MYSVLHAINDSVNIEMQTHYFPLSLAREYGRATQAYWSLTSPTHLVLFVHGFGGDPVGTWPEFATLLTKRAGLPVFDYIFYGYDGKTTQANSSALALFNFLDVLLRKPEAVHKQSLPFSKRAPFQYERVVVVAHSLGALVTRRALLHAASMVSSGTPVPWLDSVRMVLFAPAHHGAYVANLVSAFVVDTPWFLGKLLGYYLKYRSPLLDDLQPNSTVIKSLKDETDAIKARLPQPPWYIRATNVLWAEHERVVINAPFCVDAPAGLAVATDHFGVCKPRDLTNKALEYVWNAL